jgi:deazaflavin-dependent oxidoreductase (nitroreductase family)
LTDPEFLRKLDSTKEIEITVTGRISGRSISTPIWFIHEGSKLYLVPVTGSDSNWYRNVLANPSIQISAEGNKIAVKASPITAAGKVNQIVEKLRSKYGTRNVAEYYSKPDVALEVPI